MDGVVVISHPISMHQDLLSTIQLDFISTFDYTMDVISIFNSPV